MHNSTPLSALRNLLIAQGLDGMIVPRADAHQSEDCTPHDNKLAWLTGFSGSAGLALVLQDRALMFVDGRYHYKVPQADELQETLKRVSYENVSLKDHELVLKSERLTLARFSSAYVHRCARQYAAVLAL